MMKKLWSLLSVFLVLGIVNSAAADVNPIVIENLTPIHDTYATHDDGLVHGTETWLRVGIEPQECVPGGYDPCNNDEECCNAGSGYNYCAPLGDCGNTTPVWTAFRKYRSYLRFDLSNLPEGEIQSALLRLTEVGKVQELGGPFKLTITGLKKIGLDNPICEWNENSLNDTNGTTWSSLPQNLSVTPEGQWHFDVTKAVRDWVNGDPDAFDPTPKPNCGFHFYDDAFGKKDAPIQRWVDFGSKESQFPPQLKVEVALDLDNDGYFGDCNEEDPDINPGAIETCDGVDQDCDGKIDEENCDGLDNDCDGAIDEDEGMCGDGQLCIYHQCYSICEDECGGPTSLVCHLNGDGLWERWGCKKDADEDPCWDWYMAEECEAGQFCQYGYCASNCNDLCDVEGAPECEKDKAGNWYVGTCGHYDNEGCLELGNPIYCGPDATCDNGVCGTPCSDTCETVGAVQCVGQESISACYDWDENGCLEWAEIATCDAGVAPCEEGECGGQPIACEDDCLDGAFMCEIEDGTAFLYECVIDQDGDPCLEWGNVSECPPPGQCNAMKNACAEEEPPVEEEPDVVTVEEGAPEVIDEIDTGIPWLDVGETDAPPPDTGGIEPDTAVSADTGFQPDLVGATEDEPKKKKNKGCTTGSSSSTGLWLLFLTLGLLYLPRRIRT